MVKFLIITIFLLNDFFSILSPVSPIQKISRIERAIESWDVKYAEEEIKKLSRQSKYYNYLYGKLFFYEGDYKDSLSYLEKAASKTSNNEVIQLYSLVKNTYEENKNFKKVETEHFIIFYHRGMDVILLPYAEETLEKSWFALKEDLDFAPEGKIRVEIYPFYEDFMRVSTLTRKDIETSGTIALCNYNKVMITSPKATLQGYRWRDTLNHELTHYFLTKMTLNYAPLWLQEGVAKSEEQRWRRGKGPRPLSPWAQAALLKAIKKNNFVTFREMIPSFAKLGSGERVTLAFAEVLSMVHMIYERGGYPFLRKLILSSVKYHGNSERMIRAIGYKNLDTFLASWKRYIKKLHLVPLSQVPEKRIELGRIKKEKDKYFRIGEMLKNRLHFFSASYEYKKAIENSSEFDPVLYYKYAFSLYNSGEMEQSKKILLKALRFSPDYESDHTLLGMIYLKEKNYTAAVSEFREGIDINPFNPLVHRGIIEAYKKTGKINEAKKEEKILKELVSYSGG